MNRMTKVVSSLPTRFYSSLYTSASAQDPNLFDTFSQSLQIPNTDQDDWEEVERDITYQEISAAISSLSSGKTPGPDSLPNKFYKTFSNILTPFTGIYRVTQK